MIVRSALLATALATLSACNPFYVLEAAYHEGGILLRRKDIAHLLSSEGLSDSDRQKLTLVRDARDFAIARGLTPGGSFTKYSPVDRDTLAWVVMASQPTAFELKSWWFPIIGSVPYKGFFSEREANRAALQLQQNGYETFVRGTDAFSTLGWFNDPVLSTTLRHDDIRIVNTVIHESLHTTVWVPGHVPFNESLANFVGLQGAREFFRQRVQAEFPSTARDRERAEQDFEREFEITEVITKVYDNLKRLYDSTRSEDEKLVARVTTFEAAIAPLRARYPTMKAFRTVNNAEIMQLKVYLTELELFRALFDKRGENWALFLEDIRGIAKAVKSFSDCDPFQAVRDLVQGVSDDKLCRPVVSIK